MRGKYLHRNRNHRNMLESYPFPAPLFGALSNGAHPGRMYINIHTHPCTTWHTCRQSPSTWRYFLRQSGNVLRGSLPVLSHLHPKLVSTLPLWSLLVVVLHASQPLHVTMTESLTPPGWEVCCMRKKKTSSKERDIAGTFQRVKYWFEIMAMSRSTIRKKLIYWLWNDLEIFFLTYFIDKTL